MIPPHLVSISRVLFDPEGAATYLTMFSIVRQIVWIVLIVLVLLLAYAVFPWVLALFTIVRTIHNFGR